MYENYLELLDNGTLLNTYPQLTGHWIDDKAAWKEIEKNNQNFPSEKTINNTSQSTEYNF